MSQPITHVSVIFTTEERNILLSFIQSGMKADVNIIGLSPESSNVITNALHLAKKLQAGTPVEQVKVSVIPPNEDVTDPASINP